MDALTKDLQRPVPWTLLYADDVMLRRNPKIRMNLNERRKRGATGRHGSKFACTRRPSKKTEYLTIDKHESGTIKTNDTDLQQAATFRYLSSIVSSDGSLAHEIIARVNAAWLKWRSLTCDCVTKTFKTVSSQRSTEPWYALSRFMVPSVGLPPRKLSVELASWG
ncbi:hypothetical protein Y032_0031g2432 [Ancylostoma ceylanicum]|uniref:Reverse transcriptase domain-containing protein n=1 Tax=Ancylostoma ceylanicum TaxID=53326 RepID=A0A016UQ86_9BILA|nr:hypothetical protein Y032_0031g2432 [Ancylostoma ceylanicum]